MPRTHLWNGLLGELPAFIAVSSLLGAIAGIGCYRLSCSLISHLCNKIAAMRSFTQDVSHELAGTTESLLVRIQLMASDMAHTEKLTQHLAMLNETAARTSSLVQDFKTLAKYDDLVLGQLSIIRVDHLLHQVCADLSVLFDARQIRLDVRRVDAGSIIGNKEGVRRIIANLLSNALRYTKPGCLVSISLIRQPRHLHITVTDDGPGIDPDDLPNLFKRFYRGATAPETEGTGLGLAIVKAVVDSHGGSITVASKPGEGTQFDVVLPKYAETNFLVIPVLQRHGLQKF